MQRFETRDPDRDFYPETSYGVEPGVIREGITGPSVTLTWPAGVRRYSYRSYPDLPSGGLHDNVQIGFNVLPESRKAWYPAPPGAMPHFTRYTDTDYEYALNPVADEYGGGTEVWRLNAPGMPEKHFYPREPASPLDGPVKDAKLTIVRTPTVRIVEAAIPWSEIPEVKMRLDAGATIKFSFVVNYYKQRFRDGQLSAYRSVAKQNGSFHDLWTPHWANELEFAFEK